MKNLSDKAAGGRAAGMAGIAVAGLVVLGLSSALHTRFAMGEKPVPRHPLTVKAAEYEIQESFQREVSYVGLISAGRQATLGFEVAGTVAEMPWREGSPVAQGQVIAKLDDSTLQSSARATRAELAQAESELELAELKARRQRELRETGAVSREAFDETRLRAQALASRVEAVGAQLQSIEISIAKASLKAPYTGVIADRFLHKGSVVTPGTPVVHFIESAGREANIGVSVVHTSALRPGEKYTLSLRGQPFSSELLSVRPDVDPMTRVTTAVFAIPEDIAAVDGEPVNLKLSETIKAIGGWLPLSALLEGNRGLWTVLRLEQRSNETVSVREAVEVIEVKGDQAFVLGTLASGSRVIANGVHRITPDTPVAVAGAR